MKQMTWEKIFSGTILAGQRDVIGEIWRAYLDVMKGSWRRKHLSKGYRATLKAVLWYTQGINYGLKPWYLKHDRQNSTSSCKIQNPYGEGWAVTPYNPSVCRRVGLRDTPRYADSTDVSFTRSASGDTIWISLTAGGTEVESTGVDIKSARTFLHELRVGGGTIWDKKLRVIYDQLAQLDKRF